MQLLLGTVIGAVIGLIPGGNSVTASWVGILLSLQPEALVATVISSFIVSGVKMTNPVNSGNLYSMAIGNKSSRSHEVLDHWGVPLVAEDIEVPRIVLERSGYFLAALFVAPSFVFLQNLLMSYFSPFGYFAILLTLVFLYISPPFDVIYNTAGEGLVRATHFLAMLIVAVISLSMFWYCQILNIANPVYAVAVAVFFPYSELLKWGKCEKKGRTIVSDLNKRYNPLNIFLATALFSTPVGANSAITAAHQGNFRRVRAKDGELKMLGAHAMTKKTMLVEAIINGAGLGTASYSGVVGRNILIQPLKATVDHFDSTIFMSIPVVAILATVIAWSLSRTKLPYFYNTNVSKYIFYGSMAGTMVGNIGLVESLPLVGSGLLLDLLLHSDKGMNEIDPLMPGRAKATIFVYPILFS
jgi:hypothetical protein